MTEEQMIQALEAILSREAQTTPDEGTWSTPTADKARGWCDRLLNAAQADGHFGCKLCCS